MILAKLENSLEQAQIEYEKSTNKEDRDRIKSLNINNWHSLSFFEKKLIKSHKKFLNRIKNATNDLNTHISWTHTINNADKILQELHDTLLAPTISIDLEFCENTKKILEVGVSIFKNGIISNYHFIVKEHYKIRNYLRVPDNKDNFLFGTSQILSLDEIKHRIHNIYDSADIANIVGHDVRNDIGFLNESKCNTDVNILDTQYYGPIYHKINKVFNLKDLIECTLNTSPKFLHNAGNDANYTLKTLLKFANL